MPSIIVPRKALMGLLFAFLTIFLYRCTTSTSGEASKEPPSFITSPLVLSSTDSVLLDSIKSLYRGKNAAAELDTFISELEKHHPVAYLVLAYALYQRGVLEYFSGQYEKAAHYYFNALKRYKANGAPQDYNTICKLYRNISSCYYFAEGHLDSTYHFADAGLLQMNQYPDSLIDDNIRIGLYQWGGIAARDLGDLAASAELLKSGVDLCIQQRGGYKICGPTIMNYAWTLSDQNNLDSALYYSRLAETTMLVYQSNFSFGDSAYLADIYNNRSETLLFAGNTIAALSTQRKSLEINRRIRPKDKLAVDYNNIGFVYTHEKKLDSARYYIQQSMQLNRISKDTFHLAQNLENLADIALYVGNHREALNFLDKAVYCYFPNPGHLPIVSTFYKYELVLPMSKRASTLAALNRENPDQYPLEKVLRAYEQVDSLVSALQYSVNSEQSKILLVEKLKPVYEDMIGICASAWKTSGKESYLLKAFQYLERSKALILRERRQKAQLLYSIGRGKYSQQERKLMSDLNRLNLQLRQEHSSGKKTNELLDHIHHVQLALKAHRDSLYQDMAGYESFPSNKNPDISQMISTTLKKNQVAVDYFIGEKTAYAGTITRDGLNIQQLPLSPIELRERVDQFRMAIQSTSGHSGLAEPDERLALDSLFRLNGFWLYQKLIEPLEIPADITHYTIIPDDVMAFLPFGALLTTEATVAEDYSSFDYLVKKATIDHQFSLAVWYDNLRQEPSEGQGFLAVAPIQANTQVVKLFEKQPISFSPLRYNQEEVNSLVSRYGATILTGEKATKTHFEQVASQYKVIHFSGHAYANVQNPYQSFMAFDLDGDGEVLDEVIFLNEWEKMNFKADLVVLSACQTADGDLALGEGVISLARATALAGARSVVSTLWLVNQQSKVGLFHNFYRYLSEGHSRAEALRLSQLDYLKQPENSHHPYFWAGIIHLGDNRPLSLGKPSLWSRLFSS